MGKREYSFSSSPANPKDVDFTVKRAPDGKFAPHLFSSRINDAVTVEGPHGIFTYIDNSARDLVLIAGGSGIAPMRAIIRHILEQKQDVRIQLIYANKTLRDIIFKEELDELSSANDNLALHYVLENPPSGWKGGAGFITHDFIKKRVRDFSKPLFYICGPPPMVQKMIETVTRLGATHDRIKLEQFN